MRTMVENETNSINSVDEAPLCHGCGFISHYVYEGTPLCGDCWNNRNWWQGGGPLRVVTESDTYHETPLCPAVINANVWYYWTDESCMHADLSGEMDKCVRCHSHLTFGFDEYSGEENRQSVIGHA